MTNWQEFIQKDVPLSEWPYPIRYEVQNEITADVLILGGGVAGCHAAITLARMGLNPVIVEKGATKRSGSGGAGVDHWHRACTNPASKVSPEEMTEAIIESYGEYGCGIFDYINCREGYDALLDCEKMGVKIRDVDDEFKALTSGMKKRNFCFPMIMRINTTSAW